MGGGWERQREKIGEEKAIKSLRLTTIYETLLN